MADEKTAEILKLYSDLTPNEKHLVGVFVNAMILSRNKNDRQTHRLLIYVNIIPQKGTKINDKDK